MAADAGVCCSGDAKVFQHLKTSYAIDIAATAMLEFHNMNVFVERCLSLCGSLSGILTVEVGIRG